MTSEMIFFIIVVFCGCAIVSVGAVVEAFVERRDGKGEAAHAWKAGYEGGWEHGFEEACRVIHYNRYVTSMETISQDDFYLRVKEMHDEM